MSKLICLLLTTVLLVTGCKKDPIAPGPATPSGPTILDNDAVKLDIVSTTVPTGVNSICFPEAEVGVVATMDGKIYRTKDEGATWTLCYADPAANLPWLQVLFTSPQVGYAVGGSLSCNGVGCVPPAGRILKTVDGGRTWTSILQANNAEFFSIAANSLGELFVVSNTATAQILKSTNAGASWSQVAALPFRLTKITFDRNLGFCASASGKIIKSTDNGNSWAEAATFSYPYLNELAFSTGIGFCVAGYGPVYKTTDDAKSWKLTSNTKFSALAVEALTPTSCLIFGAGQYSGGDFGVYNGSLRQTTNAGDSWTESVLTSIGPVRFTSFYTAKSGYALAGSTLLRVNVK